ncbi:hypothetical protein OH76DRAFT_1406348 [Lentinus brumalis]|uniref:Uncharacterized protein n=1 Tax=Lentinus brumalis TaxID=2498619 RepID=A0A371D3B3_9APHY|nr:hypothetical protein OH76DRAFT_1406348 [Polyporus brumalis]
MLVRPSLWKSPNSGRWARTRRDDCPDFRSGSLLEVSELQPTQQELRQDRDSPIRNKFWVVIGVSTGWIDRRGFIFPRVQCQTPLDVCIYMEDIEGVTVYSSSTASQMTSSSSSVI